MKKNIKLIIKEFINYFKINFKELVNKKTFYRQIPNLLTSIRAITLIPFNILYFTGHLEIATILLIIAFFTDSIDGKIARKYNLVSKFGANLDALCDKIMAIGVLIPVCTTNCSLIINLSLEVIIALINTIALLIGIKASSSMIGKLKTWPLFITITIAYIDMFIELNPIILISLVTITSLLQVLTALDYISKNFMNFVIKKDEI